MTKEFSYMLRFQETRLTCKDVLSRSSTQRTASNVSRAMINGHLTAVICEKGPNLFDIRAIGYGADGHVSSIVLGDRYELHFFYRPSGVQQVLDSRGGEMLRVNAGSQYTVQTQTDPIGQMTQALNAHESLVSLFGPVGLASGASANG